MKPILMIDNFDSFTYNLVQYLEELGARVHVVHHHAITLEEIAVRSPSGILISPGPGTPDDAGVSLDVVREFFGRIPILGVCLGHQVIGQAFGGRIIPAPQLMHGKTSLIYHNNQGVFANLPNPFPATRYHSLVVEEASLLPDLSVTARTRTGIIMGLKHKRHPVFGIQFHPESILTEAGRDLLRNFLNLLPAVL
ncbi:MAG: aminodeoxychorismate/anthranilate synthase component II [Gemmatimonadetes bacterium]|nr:MAG: aminodeoxychorismate/anthranilate synthase component II [Gemmatimonadota bacterium]